MQGKRRRTRAPFHVLLLTLSRCLCIYVLPGSCRDRCCVWLHRWCTPQFHSRGDGG